ncbi:MULTISPECIES: D-2-hydroxyacid dehydrogenase [Alishewanella]|uniref:Glycerate dehydrogenase n=1 Tax=Alishewanella aestuarii B11 TaxID=1197174 RepID=J2IDB8_9ALTE|nr:MULTISPECIES: D-2-hydroxyacid dehydrogenase [Alishewanella]EJI84674.1 glycerate dehydrogenase [Alishewanella aestuarii B11]OCW97403.1 glycerate dehydrogenase [Alishewanella sp. HH-ZS]
MRYQIVFADAATLGDADLSALHLANCQLQVYAHSSADELPARLQDADIAIVNKCRLDAALIAKLPRLKAIMVAATGMDNIDLQAARTAGIQVFNVTDYAGTAVPQHVFALLLALSNQLFSYSTAVQRGDWSRSQSFCLLDYPIFELAGKTMVIVGYGVLGQATAALARAFGMKVLIAERPSATEIRPGRLAFGAALAEADIVSLHCPLTADTRHMINKNSLAGLKTGAVLINTARGALIEPNALLEALKTGQVGAAALDVLSTEPPPASDPLLNCKLPNLLITPHIGWASREARTRMVLKIADNIQGFLER